MSHSRQASWLVLSVSGRYPVCTRCERTAGGASLFDRLVGRWELKGTIDGKQTVHDVDAEFVLNRGYVRLHESFRVSRTRPARRNTKQ